LEDPLQLLEQTKVGVGTLAGLKILELDEEIEIARIRVEPAGRGGPEEQRSSITFACSSTSRSIGRFLRPHSTARPARYRARVRAAEVVRDPEHEEGHSKAFGIARCHRPEVGMARSSRVWTSEAASDVSFTRGVRETVFTLSG